MNYQIGYKLNPDKKASPFPDWPSPQMVVGRDRGSVEKAV